MLTNIKNMILDDQGATLVEYGLIVALIAAACIAAITLLGANITSLFNDVAGKVLAAKPA